MSRENVEIVRRLYRAAENIGKDDLYEAIPELIRQFADPEIEWVEAPSRIDGRTYRGHEGVQRALEHWLDHFEEYRFEIREILDCGDDVLVTGRDEGRGAVSGAPVSADSYQVFTIRDGRITRYRGFSDRESALAAAGPSSN